MTTLMNFVTCSLCNIKIDELNWKEILVSANHSKLCRNVKDKIAKKFLEMIFNAFSKKNEIDILKSEKIYDFWQLQFSTKQPKEKINVLCFDSIDFSELEASLTSDFQNFIQKVTPDIRETYFNLMDKRTFCKNCSIEVNKSLFLDHISSKEHKVIENHFAMNFMTYCEYCDKETKTDVWREHLIWEKHLELAEKIYCGVCNIKYDRCSNYDSKNPNGSHARWEKNRVTGHLDSNFFRRKRRDLTVVVVRLFIYLFY